MGMISLDTRNQNEEDNFTSDWRGSQAWERIWISKMTKDYEEEGYYEEHTLLAQKQSEKSDLELRGERA